MSETTQAAFDAVEAFSATLHGAQLQPDGQDFPGYDVGLEVGGHAARMHITPPVGGMGTLGEDCMPMWHRVLDTYNRHVSGGRVQSVEVCMNARRAVDAMSEPGWLEWGVLISYKAGGQLYICHLQRSIGADVERHT